MTEKIRSLLCTGSPKNIALAEQLANSQQIDLHKLILDSFPRLGLRTPADFIRLSHADFSWAGLENLEIIRNFKPIHTLKISDNGLRTLAGIGSLEQLKVLEVHRNYLRDLNGIEALPNLQSLYAADNAIEAVDVLASLPHLQHLNLSGNPIVDIRPIGACTRLETLEIRHTKLKDLSPLLGLVHLKQLIISPNQHIARQDLENLRKQLPHCEVDIDYTDPIPNIRDL